MEQWMARLQAANRGVVGEFTSAPFMASIVRSTAHVSSQNDALSTPDARKVSSSRAIANVSDCRTETKGESAESC